MVESNYEYRDLIMDNPQATKRLEAYKRCGWEVIDIRQSANARVRMRRHLTASEYPAWQKAEQRFERELQREDIMADSPHWIGKLLARL
ncbi:hypothetical protein [Lacticaseibacillus zhaodongensis]|uniref:hypothetical protein n=1 Tax=Lacticaseibacillus zhaodongensis TaxID=2668065 RepID=UPI0012D2F185|nr:hypothetical protein [Lacticaseibacillus zhaodongensis]